MGRIAERFAALRERGEGALVPFVTAGDPELATTEAVVRALAEAGADLIEIGVPFSDPIAEGPTIQRASQRSLAAGTTLRHVLQLVKTLRPVVDVPLVLMGYANSVLSMGEHGFAEAAAEVGVDGLIVVDLPPEESDGFSRELERVGIDRILLVAPTTTRERVAALAAASRGFLYAVSTLGVTGARSEVAQGVEELVRRAREAAGLPVCVGFGVSTAQQAAEIGAYADGVVVGSALIDRLEGARDPAEAAERAAAFAAELKAPLRPSRG